MIEAILKKHIVPEQDYIFGIADLTGMLDKKFERFNLGISIARKLDDEIVNRVVSGPTREYYSHYKQINIELEALTINISKDLNDCGIESLNIEPTVNTNDLDSIYSKTLKTDLSHKMVATRAGLGWIGKTDLFISKKLGPRVRLVSILMRSDEIPASTPIIKSGCGKCNLCVEVCPAKTATGLLWDIHVKREDFFDPWKCRKQCAEFGKTKLGLDARVCGMCVSICPVGQKKQKIRQDR